MKGKGEVIEVLNQVLTNELTAINQYFIHAKMCENWGFGKLGAKIRQESIDEMRHADEIISRILYLEGIPNLQRLGKVNIGQRVKEQLSLDLKLEVEAIDCLSGAVETCRAAGDLGSAELLKNILLSEEVHLDWIEAQLQMLEAIGEPNYLAQQVE